MEQETENKNKKKVVTKMLYKRYKIAYNFAKLESKQGFGDTIGNGKISMDMANREQEQ